MLHVSVLITYFIIWLIVFGLFVWFAKTKKTNYTIVAGSLLFTATFMLSVVFFPDSDYSKMVKAATVVTPAATAAATAAAATAATTAAAAPIPRALFSASSLITGRRP
jgi:aspartate/tyrosine/aromatic aminotransferase